MALGSATGTATTLGERLRALRTARGLSQRELAEPEYTAAYVSTIEAGRRSPSPDALGHFAARLGVAVDELASGRPPDLEARLELALHEARLAVSAGQVDEADAAFAGIGAKAREFDLGELDARATEGRALCAERSGDLGRAGELYEAAQRRRGSGSPLASVPAVTGRARCAMRLGDANMAVHLLEGLLDTLDREGLRDPNALMRLHATLVGPYMELGLYKRAARSGDEALRLVPEVSDAEGLAKMHLDVARILIHEGRTDEGMDALRRAEDLYRQLLLQTEIAYAHLARGYLLARQEELVEARAELERAVGLLEVVGGPVDVACTLLEIARIERLEGRPDDAERLLERSIGLLGDTPSIALASCHRELAMCRSDRDHAQAEALLERACAFYERAGEAMELALTCRMLGDVHAAAGRIEDAADAYRRGLVAAEQRG